MTARILAACVTLAVIPFVAAQPSDQPADERRPPRATEIPTEGFWPTRLMLERVLDRIADSMREDYGLDEEQDRRNRELLKRTIPKFLNENRAEIQTLMNQFFEAQFAGEAPEPADVAVWSQRVLPLLHDFQELSGDMADEMRTWLSDEQQIKLEGELAAFQTGVTLVSNKLHVWANGGYDPATDWVPDEAERRRRRHEEDQLAQQAMEEARQARLEELGYVAPATEEAAVGGAGVGGAHASPTTSSAPAVKDEWVRYVEDFVEQYELDREQAQRARLYLAVQIESRDRHLRRNREKIEEVTKLLRSADSDEQRQRAQQQYDALTGPVEKLFQELKDKLQTLPTREQIRRAEERKRAAEEQQRERERERIGAKPASTRPAATAPASQPSP